ncbi:MAG: sensor histidine kinase, partial [Bacillota bacterium]
AADDLRRSADIPCILDLPAQPLQLSTATSHHLIRIAQEALVNVGKHARAKQVGIRLSTMPNQVTLEISDDGIGFDPDLQAEQTGHYGIRGMRERAELAGGRFSLNSRKGQGTTLQVTLPIFEE